MNEPRTLLDFLQLTTEHFKKNGVESARLEAELMLAHVLKLDRVGLYVRYDQPLKPEEVAAYRGLVKRRSRHEPAQYILGKREFWSLSFEVEKGVLIPRPDSEVLIEELVALLAPQKAEPLRIADLGTGSGCLAIALATELTAAEVWAGDIADIPLRVAQHNAERLGVGARVKVVRADSLAALVALAGGPFDAVVSNPPYIPTAAYQELPPHIKGWEPPEALHAGVDGLDVLDVIVAQAHAALVPGGPIALEVSDAAQAGGVLAKLQAAGFTDARIRADYAGLARAVVARRSV